MKAEQPLTEINGLDAKEVLAFAAVGLERVIDVLNWLPKRYEDRRRFGAFPVQASNVAVCLRGVVVDNAKKWQGGKNGCYEVRVQSHEETAFSANCITLRWFNMPYISKVLAVGHEIIFFGKAKEYAGRLVIDHPDFEIIKDDGVGSVHVERIVPVYKNISGIHQRRLRELVYRFISEGFTESLHVEFDVDESYPRREVYNEVHFPKEVEQAEAARRYFALDEFFRLQLSVAWRKRQYEQQRGRVLGEKTTLLKAFYANLPFDLTGAQKRSVKEMVADMRKEKPMHRLLQGDVGSGKTFVAMCGALLAVDSGVQVAIMAPTQILAEQHYLTFRKWLDPLGVAIVLRTGNRREDNGQASESGSPIIIGTHALLYENTDFTNLGFVVIDEQHKFGVEQRSKLVRQGHLPDVLVMTATPIPRTLTLTIYGDLDVSILDERPQGRGKVVTGVRPNAKVTDVTKFIKQQLDQGRQAYLVYPLVEESDSLSAQSAKSEHDRWQKRLKDYQVGLLHGKMTGEQKDAVMSDFRSGKADVLVSTTVIEVGVDVPNANLMVIYNAERFGLSQLHQLRGRIGRGEFKSYCILVTDGKNAEAMEKLQVLADTDDGFQIAEADLKLRGPGDVLGTQQSGVSELKFIEYLADLELIRHARKLADDLLQHDPDLVSYPQLRRRVMEGAELKQLA